MSQPLPSNPQHPGDSQTVPPPGSHEVKDASREAARAPATPGSRESDEHLPNSIGPYRIIRLIGRGGMGAVYEAQEEHPRRTVALKVIAPGLMTPAMRRRFEYEADVLARLEHPGIARIYRAGTADTGYGPQPYFAMELIRGQRVDEYVRNQSLALSQRLQL